MSAAGPGAGAGNDVNDVIAALATPEGSSPLALVRLSGTGATAAVVALGADGTRIPGRSVTPIALRWDGAAAPVPALAVGFAAGASYTGEESVELLVPGAPALIRRLLETLRRRGVRPAEPGEFTRRAFLSGRIDLTGAESVAELIAAESEQAARAIRRTLDGELADAVRAIGERLHDLIALLEAGLDFAEQEVEPPQAPWLRTELGALEAAIEGLLAGAGRSVAEEARVRLILWGRANAGKSSLLNRLAGRDAAIVADLPGTTRDPVTATLGAADLAADGLPAGDLPAEARVELVDLAGVRDEAPDDEIPGETLGEIETAAAELGGELLADATRILYVLDGTRPAAELRAEWLGLDADLRARAWPILNKSDLRPAGAPPGLEEAQAVSAATGEGVGALRRRIARLLAHGSWTSRGEGYLFTERQHGHLEECRAALIAARGSLTGDAGAGVAPELLVVDLRAAHERLEEVTGAISSEATLDRIFARFCLGK